MECHMKREFAMRVFSTYMVSIMPCLIAQSTRLPNLILLICLREADSVSDLSTHNPPVRVAPSLQERQEWDVVHSAENL